MSLKKNESKMSYSPKGGRKWSMTGRLTVIYTLAAFLMLIISSVVLYFVLVSGLYKVHSRYLIGKIGYLRTEATSPHFTYTLREELGRGVRKIGDHFYARVVDLDTDEVIAESPGMPPKRAFQFQGGRILVTRSEAAGRSLLQAAQAVSVSGNPGKRLLIEVALDYTQDKALIVRYLRAIMVMLAVGIILAAKVGHLAARKALRPLVRLDAAVRRISASHTNERIDVLNWPGELTLLTNDLNSMLERIDDSFRRLTQFSSNLAHELRTPINNMLGSAEVALSRERTADGYRSELESNIEELQRLSSLIDRLLFLARAENPFSSIERQEFEVSDEISKVCEFYAPLAEDLGVRLSHSGAGMLKAEPMLFRRAVSNLVANALSNTQRGGRVEVLAAREDGLFRITVKDTGKGISAEHLPHIFDRFYRVDRSRSHGGAGLGLSIVKSIMDLHGSDVTVRSTPGSGTEIALVFKPPSAAVDIN
jgi:two-component system, OmpR family, heavy metal sensor histidine kinase CusS